MTYNYLITVQFEARDGVQRVSWLEGVITPGPGQTRSDVFAQVFQAAVNTVPEGSNPVPVFFSLEPEELGR